MRTQFVVGKLKGEARKTIIYAIQKGLQGTALEAIKSLLWMWCSQKWEVLICVASAYDTKEEATVGGFSSS